MLGPLANCLESLEQQTSRYKTKWFIYNEYGNDGFMQLNFLEFPNLEQEKAYNFLVEHLLHDMDIKFDMHTYHA